MAKSLVIVESPAKAKTIKKYLGKGFSVKASVGHVKDLPKSKLGVDVEDNFKPEYVPINGKKKVITEIKKAAKEVDRVYLAPDPDREGEAIAWHIAEELKPICSDIKRVLFTEITRKGVTQALEHPVELDGRRFESQQARRILDRLVGYQISPILWKKVRRGLSAGRVQSVAVRLIVDRENEIRAFIPVEYWSVLCDTETPGGAAIEVKLTHVDGEKAELANEEEATAVVKRIEGGPLNVVKVTRKKRRRKPLAPFITSKLQQDAARQLRFTAKRTMGLAQRLYEGVEVGDEGQVGLITYMRTDSTRISDDAVAAVREWVDDRFGKEYLPDAPPVYKMKKGAQDAHEAIRPTEMRFDPATVESLIPNGPEKAALVKLYTLIWNRFVASQMVPAVYDQTAVDIDASGCGLRANGQVLRFDGYRAIYQESEEGTAKESNRELPDVSEGEELKLLKVNPNQHFTQPPPRFSEASLVKVLEEDGIGRPSTYANILSTIQDRKYAEKREGRFYPTELGELVNTLLCESFPQIVNAEFTAKMEEGLDEVEQGAQNWVDLLSQFYGDFSEAVERAKVEMRDVRREETPTEHTCEKCQNTMVIKWGRNGKFLACSGYPDCKNTSEFKMGEDGKVIIVEQETTDEVCDACEAPMVVKHGRYGSFLACSRYPDCKTTKAISVGVDCPTDGCDGYVTEKRSRRGKVFYGCSNYAKSQCGFVSWDRPIEIKCPQCKKPFLLRKENKQGIKFYCHDKDCGHSQSFGDDTEITPEYRPVKPAEEAEAAEATTSK